jgi:hypothetical protein
MQAGWCCLNPATTIAVNVPKKSKVNIAVYDLLGHHVIELLDEGKLEGRHSVQFHGTSLSSGIPICGRTVRGNQILTRKMALMK